MSRCLDAARGAIARCQMLATCSEEPGRTTRTFLSPPMRDVHDHLRTWMEACGMEVRLDAVGNLRGTIGQGPRLVIGSHLDTVRDAGAYDGVLGVVLGLALVELLEGHVPFTLEVVGCAEEEGVRFGVPFLGSRALVGTAAPLLDLADADGISVRQAIRSYGLDADQLEEARLDAAGYLEFHIEQGPVLEHLDAPLGVVDAIAGQSRLDLTFTGQANHAGTTPMPLRRDALAAAAEWMLLVEHAAHTTSGLMATVGQLHATPNIRNVINGRVVASLDVRHAADEVRRAAVDHLCAGAHAIGRRRGVAVDIARHLDQPAVAMAPALTGILAEAIAATGLTVHHLTSGAGHDAMIVAPQMPAAMLFLRSPGGISHHPDERVLVEDVAAALEVGLQFLHRWDPRHA